MKVKGLRIGNIVKNVNEIAYVYAFDLKRIALQYFENGQIYVIDTWDLNFEELSKDWLLKCGFEKHENNGFIKYLSKTDRYYSIRFMFNKFPLVMEVNDNRFPLYNVKYVHQLQNLYFTIVGEELKISENATGTN